jgi:hypothetical protein
MLPVVAQFTPTQSNQLVIKSTTIIHKSELSNHFRHTTTPSRMQQVAINDSTVVFGGKSEMRNKDSKSQTKRSTSMKKCLLSTRKPTLEKPPQTTTLLVLNNQPSEDPSINQVAAEKPAEKPSSATR